jgi:hypothetical protein
MQPLEALTWLSVIAVALFIVGILVPWIIRGIRAAIIDPDPDGSAAKKAKAAK